MEINRTKTIAFSGHRTSKLATGTVDLCTKIYHTIKDLYENQGYDTFISGMAIGFDTLAALAVQDLQAIYPNVKLIAAVPFMGQELRYSWDDKETYSEILAQCDDVRLLSDYYHAGVYHKRNDFMVANCSTLVCFYNGSEGGTRYTVEKAQREGVRIINLCE